MSGAINYPDQASNASVQDALSKALLPKPGMRRIPFSTESYPHPSIPLSAKRLLNLYAEAEPADARSQAALIATPGSVYRETLGTGPVVAFNTDLVGGFYAVSGNHAYRNTGGVTVDLGVVGYATDSTLLATQIGVTIAASQNAVVICVPPNAFTATHSGALNQIGGTFPGAGSVTYMDNYFIFSQAGKGTTFFISAISDPSMYDALDFANLEGHTNIIFRVITQKDELWLGGASGWEVWYDSGDVNFPFARRAGGIIPYGVATPNAIAQVDGSVFWVGDDGMVFRSNGYSAVRVSTHALEAIISASTPSSSTACAYVMQGHAFYCLTLPTAIPNRTLCYDCATQKWHERSSSSDGGAIWLARVAGRIGPGAYVGDKIGNLYTLDMNGSTDNGVLIPRQTTLPPIHAGTYKASVNRLEIEMEVGTAGSNGPVQIEWSDDGGNTYPRTRTLSAGSVGNLRARVVSTRHGSFRDRVYRITTYGTPRLYNVDADISGGTAG